MLILFASLEWLVPATHDTLEYHAECFVLTALKNIRCTSRLPTLHLLARCVDDNGCAQCCQEACCIMFAHTNVRTVV